MSEVRVVPAWPSGALRPAVAGRRRRPAAAVSGVVLVLVAGFAILAPWLWPVDPRALDLAAVLTPPSPAHPFGTDSLGRDLVARVASGLATSLLLAVAASGVATVVGVVVGSVASAVGGVVDDVVMRLVDAVNALPHLLLGVVIAALWRGEWWAVAAAIALTHWTQVARIVRAQVLTVRERDYVAAAVTAGATRLQVWVAHLLPAVVPQTLVAVVLLLPHAVWHESALSFLGVGLPPTDPSLGTLLEEARAGILSGAWWLLVVPGGVLAATCLALGGVADALRLRWSEGER